jgi:hypothetical protein
MGGSAGLAHAGASFQERDLAGRQAAVMDKLFAQTAAGPAAGKKRFIAVERFVTDFAVPGFNPQQHRLPRSAASPDAHVVKYSEAVGGKTRRRGWSLMIFCARATRGRGLLSLDARNGRSISPHP